MKKGKVIFLRKEYYYGTLFVTYNNSIINPLRRRPLLPLQRENAPGTLFVVNNNVIINSL